VSHDHPDGQVHFNVFVDRRVGQDWGSFSTDSDVLPTMPGPEFNLDPDVPNVATVHATKISQVRASSDSDVHAVLLARLRFKPDEDEPTLL
jgi:abelson tyrosine-protein kinase 1